MLVVERSMASQPSGPAPNPCLPDTSPCPDKSDSSHDTSQTTELDKSPNLVPAAPASDEDAVSGLLADVSLEHNAAASPASRDSETGISFIQYQDETQMPLIMRLIQKDLSEPYSIYTYRYFIHNWPNLCFLAMTAGGECVGAIVCKLDLHKKVTRRGYIAMLAVDSSHRKKRIGSTLVKKAIEAMVEDDADEVVLETEITNKPALKLYENLGFVRDKRLFRYYLNGVDASRLKLWLR